MKPIDKILFPTDFSKCAANAFRYAVSMADRYNAHIDLLHVMSPGTVVSDMAAVSAPVTPEQIRSVEEVCASFIDDVLVEMHVANSIAWAPKIVINVEVGSPIQSINGFARNHDADLIVMGTKGKHSRMEKMFGSIATGVLRIANIPVFVVPEYCKELNLNVAGYATSLSDTDPYHIWGAAQLLAKYDPVIHVVHVKLPHEKRTRINIHELEAFFTSKNGHSNISFHEIPAENIEDALDIFNKTVHTDLLVMHSPQRTFLNRLAHRSQTRKMALYSRVPLLVLK